MIRDDDLKHTELSVPFLIGDNYRHVMSTVNFLSKPGHVELGLTVVADGVDANDLIARLTAGEQFAFQIVAIPVTPRSTRSQ